jgi:hypothetical protein
MKQMTWRQTLVTLRPTRPQKKSELRFIIFERADDERQKSVIDEVGILYEKKLDREVGGLPKLDAVDRAGAY